MTVKWSEDATTSPADYDLCGQAHGKYVDVCSNGSGKWSVLFNCVRLKNDFASRDEAQHWAETADLIEELSEAPRH